EEGEQEAQDAEIDGVPDQETDREEDTEGDDSDSREYKTDLLVGPAGHLVGQGDLLQSPGVRSVRCGFLPRHAPKSTCPRKRERRQCPARPARGRFSGGRAGTARGRARSRPGPWRGGGPPGRRSRRC